MFAVDSWRIARDNFQVSSRRLKNLAEFFEIGNKEGVEGGLWMAAAYDGSKEAMDKIVEHNVIDVEVLEKLACLSFPYLKFIRRL
jgi:histidinol phosphatase-like enzyme